MSEETDQLGAALDELWSSEPADLKAARAPFDKLVQLLQDPADWRALDRAYRTMIVRARGYSKFDGFRADLYVTLGELYRTRDKNEDAANVCAEEARKLDPKSEQRAELRKKIDAWIAGGAMTFEPALGLLALQTFPPDVSVFDDAITRAGYPPNAKLYLDRALMLMPDFNRQDDHLADLERAYKYAGDRVDIRAMAARTLAQHHGDMFDDYNKAIPLIEEAISLNPGKTDDEVTLLAFERGMLANWLEKRGDREAALAIRTDLAENAPPSERYRHLKSIVDLHAKGADWDAVEEVCKTMTNALEATTAEAWLKLLEADEFDPDRIKRVLVALAASWPSPQGRALIQHVVRIKRTTEPMLIPVLDATFIPLANEGLAESRGFEDELIFQGNNAALADELTRRGDPRGELISLQLKLEATPADYSLVMRRDELISQNAFRWLGPLEDSSVVWRPGYVTNATHIISSEGRLADIAWIAGHPSLRFLDELTIQLASDPTAALLGAAEGLRRIPKLVIGIWTPRSDEQRGQLVAALPNIEFAGLPS